MKIRFLLLLILFLNPSSGYAGAWLNEVGSSKLINNFYFFHFNQFSDTGKIVNDRPDFEKYEFKPYYEYGLTNNYGIGFSPSFQRVKGEYVGAFESGEDRNEAFAGVDVFLKRKILQSAEHGYAVSLIPQIELPGIYKEETTPFLGKQESFWSLMAALGVNTYSIEGNYGYINFETGFRSRFTDSFSDDGGASYKAELVVSLPMEKDHSLNLGVNYTKSISSYPNGSTSFLNRYGYDSLQLSVTDTYKFKNFDVEVGYIHQPYAKNTGVGQGLKISVLNRF